MSIVLIRKHMWRQTQGECHVETVRYWNKTSTSQQLPLSLEARREVWNRPSFKALRRKPPCRHPDFRLLSSRTVSNNISVVLSYSVCGALLQQPQKMCQTRRSSLVILFILNWMAATAVRRKQAHYIHSVFKIYFRNLTMCIKNHKNDRIC